MKLTPTLIGLLFATMATASGEAWADQGTEKDRASGQQFGLDQSVVVAEADRVNDEDAPYRQIVNSFLERDDFVAANNYVDTLSETTDAAPETLRALKSHIRRIKTARILDYAEKIREAIVSSDFSAVTDYNERMRRLTTDEPLSDPSSTKQAETDGSEVPEDQAPAIEMSPSKPEIDGATITTPEPVAADLALVWRMRTALDEDRLFPPSDDNAFDLAAAGLSAMPDDPEISSILDDIIGRQQTLVLTNLDAGRPETALELADQLLEAVNSLEAEHAPSPHRSPAKHWIEQVRPEIIDGLIASTEKAIEKRRLTFAPDGELSAEGYVGLVASELGQDHDEVRLLADRIIASYQELIDQKMAQNQYDGALKLHARMAAIAARFDVSTDQVAALGSYIETQQEHDQLLLLAAQSRSKGQLIEPAGANALEFAAKAIRLAVNPAAASKVFDDVVLEQRQKIDLLIDAGDLQEAADQLQQLGSAIEQIGTKQLERANAYYAEAEQVSRRADLERRQRQERIEQAERADGAASIPVEPSRGNKPPFTFVSPF